MTVRLAKVERSGGSPSLVSFTLTADRPPGWDAAFDGEDAIKPGRSGDIPAIAGDEVLVNVTPATFEAIYDSIEKRIAGANKAVADAKVKAEQRIAQETSRLQKQEADAKLIDELIRKRAARSPT